MKLTKYDDCMQIGKSVIKLLKEKIILIDNGITVVCCFSFEI